MHLQWFPGHMTRAMRMMEEQVKLVDGIVYVLDSRAPYASINNKLLGLFGNKPVLYVLNKSDLVNYSELNLVIKDFEKNGKAVVSAVGTSDKSAKAIYDSIFNLLAPTLEKYKNKGIKRPLRVMVVGIPNTGKSTIINLICGGKKAKTGDKAGVTKDKQWVKIKDLEFLDTPGTMPPSFDNQTNAEYLAFIGSINDDILDFAELSLSLINYLVKNLPSSLTDIYKVDVENKESLQILEDIAKKRGAIKKGGEIDYERVASTLIIDLRKGKLGKILFK